jgi:hypothetical protein
LELGVDWKKLAEIRFFLLDFVGYDRRVYEDVSQLECLLSLKVKA